MTKFLKKLLLVLSVLFFALLSCEKDIYEDIIHQEEIRKDFKIKVISLEEFESKTTTLSKKRQFNKHLTTFKAENLQARSSSSSEIEIYTNEIKEITQGDYTSYTMHMKTPYSDENTFFNITIEDRKNNTSSIFITKYNTTNDWLNNQTEEFEGEITTFRLNENPTGGQNELQAYVDQIFESGEISGGGSSGGGGSSSAYPWDCNGNVITITVITETKCGCGHSYLQLLSGECTGCTYNTPQFPTMTTTYLYECVPSNNTPVDTNSGGGGGGSGSGTGGSSTTPLDQSLTTIVGEPLNVEDFAIEREKCLMKSNELSQAQKDWLNNVNNSDAREAIFDYLENNELNSLVLPPSCYSNSETINYALSLINHCIQNNLTPEEAKEHIVANIIVEQIDDSELNDCAKNILTQLKGLTQNKIAEIFKKLDNSNGIYKTKIINTDYLPSNSFGNTNFIEDPNNPGYILRNNYIIKIQNNYINGLMSPNGLKPTKLSIARILIHEIIHAYISSIYDDCYLSGSCTSLESFPLLWEEYLISKNLNSQIEHETMANDFVNIIARALQEFHTGFAVSDNVEPQQPFKDLAWYGLKGTNVFNALFPIGTQDRERIDKRNQAEDYQQSFFQVAPMGTACN